MNNVEHIAKQRIRDKALRSYVSLRQKDEAGIPEFLHETAGQCQSLLDRAYWLWIAGEFTNLIQDKSVMNEHAHYITECIDFIEQAWNKPQQHWLADDNNGLFLSNLAIFYGALKSISNYFRSEKAQRICKEIREMTFSAMMKGTHFVSQQGSAEVWGDIVAAAVPFGLISSGDLALLSALEQLNEDELHVDLSSLLSWYYSERGQYQRAKQLLASISHENDMRDSVFYNIAKEQLEGGPRQGPAQLVFDHSPVGGECPYIFLENERSPRNVLVGDLVRISTFIEPYQPKANVLMEVSVDQQPSLHITMSIDTGMEGQQSWFAELAPFTECVQVRYRFKGEIEGVVHYSDWYSFEVLQWHHIHQVIGAEQQQERLAVYYASPNRSDQSFALSIHSRNESGLAMQLSLHKQQAGNANHQAPVYGQYRIGNLQATIQESKLKLQLNNHVNEAVSTSYEADESPFIQSLLDRNGKIYKVRLSFELQNDERLYGMGERFARLEYRGAELDNYVFNQYKDQGYRTYIPVPFVLSTGGYGLFLHSSLYSIFRFATLRDDLLQIEADVHYVNQSLSWFMFTGKPLQLIGQYTSITGKPKLPPKWAFGPWMSSNNWDSEQEVDWQLAQTKKYKIPSTVMVLEQWSDESTFYIWNDAQYELKPGEERFTYHDFTFPEWGRWPNPRAMVQRAHEQGIKVLMWQAPVMKYMDGIAHAQRDEDERVMIAKQYGVLNEDGTPYRIPQYEWFRNSLVPDFTNPEASEWWLSKRQYLFDEIGVDGFKTDGGECIYGSQLKFHDGRTGAEMRNEYPNSYVKAFYEFANDHVTGGAVSFSRAGYTGAQNTPMHWAGDEKSTFDAFRSSIHAGLSSGMSGIPFWGWDLGGFSGEIPTAELFIRSVQLAVFCPVMQYHAESKGEFNLDRTPWNIAERTNNPLVLTLYKKYADLRMNLLPYIYEQARISSETGYPLMRSMFVSFPEDVYCQQLNRQYMFGDVLLVAPVTVEGATEVEVYFPQGDWISIFHGQELSGGKSILIHAELSEIPVFMQADHCLPLHLAEDCRLSDDVGNRTDDYQRWALMMYLRQSIDYRFIDELGSAVHIHAQVQGEESEAHVEVMGKRPLTLIFRGCENVTWLKLNGHGCEQSDQTQMLLKGNYVLRDDELLLTIKPGKHVIQFA